MKDETKRLRELNKKLKGLSKIDLNEIFKKSTKNYNDS